MSTCANCGKGEEDGIKLKTCNACKMVKYCNSSCQRAHRPDHKKECKKRAAELHEKALLQQPPTDEAPCCWICFEQSGENEETLVRDCSCRGGSGFAHVSCLVKYASGESRKVTNPDGQQDFTLAWRICPNCHQSYMNQLQETMTMINECLAFVEREYPTSKWRLALAMFLKCVNLEIGDDKKFFYKVISLIEEMKSNNSLPMSLRMVEAMTYDHLGGHLLSDQPSDDKDQEESLRCLEKAQAIYSLEGNDESAEAITIRIVQMNSYGNEERVLELKYWSKLYKKHIQEYGEGSATAIHTGEELYRVMRREEGRAVEALRLLTILAKRSRLTNGPDHNHTKKLELVLVPLVGARLETSMKLFELIKYESNTEECVLVGPLMEGDDCKDTHTFNVNDIYFSRRTVVVCHGLEDADHLKGKLGEVIYCDKESDSYTVKFEDESLPPLIVKRANVRAVLDLAECE